MRAFICSILLCTAAASGAAGASGAAVDLGTAVVSNTAAASDIAAASRAAAALGASTVVGNASVEGQSYADVSRRMGWYASPDSVRRDSTAAKPPRLIWTALPILFSSPDTRAGFGAMTQLVYRTVSGSRASSIKLENTYTLNRQFNIRLSSNLWSPSNRYGFESKIQFQRWPTSFYGIGNHTNPDQRESYRERILLSTTEIHRRAAQRLYIGLRQDVRYSDIDDVAADGMLAAGDIRGSGGGSMIGIGMSVSYDTRDGVLYPTRGVHVRLGTRIFSPLLGSDYTFARHRLEARAYHNLPGAQVLAGQFVGAFASGEPPFQMMSSVGELLRAYGSNRYVDRHLLVARIEYRYTPVVWRLGVAVFAGTAQVANDFADFATSRFHLSAGAGVRFQVIPSENLNLRFDVAFGGGSSGSYLDLGEAF